MEAGTPIMVIMTVAAQDIPSCKTNGHGVAVAMAQRVVTVFQFRVVALTARAFSIAVFDSLV